MLIHCTCCNQQADAKINKKTNQVVCTICGGEPQVTHAMRQAMKDNGAFIEDGKTGFCFQCNKCREQQPAVADASGKKAFCTKCGSEMVGISPFMIDTMRRMGKTVKQEVKKDEE